MSHEREYFDRLYSLKDAQISYQFGGEAWDHYETLNTSMVFSSLTIFFQEQQVQKNKYKFTTEIGRYFDEKIVDGKIFHEMISDEELNNLIGYEKEFILKNSNFSLQKNNSQVEEYEEVYI